MEACCPEDTRMLHSNLNKTQSHTNSTHESQSEELHQASPAYAMQRAICCEFPCDVTSFVPGQEWLREDRLDWRQGLLEPVRDYSPNLSTAMALRDDNGALVRSINGTTLRDLPILPRWISTKVEGFRIHYWMTLDRRVSYNDIIDRMHFRSHRDGGDGPLSLGNYQIQRALSKRITDWRKKNGVLAPWRNRNNAAQTEISVVERLTREQIEHNTWWKVDLIRGKMVQPCSIEDPYAPEHDLPPQRSPSIRIQAILNKIEEMCQLELEQRLNDSGKEDPPNTGNHHSEGLLAVGAEEQSAGEAFGPQTNRGQSLESSSSTEGVQVSELNAEDADVTQCATLCHQPLCRLARLPHIISAPDVQSQLDNCLGFNKRAQEDSFRLYLLPTMRYDPELDEFLPDEN
ncbi:hypothetical protein AOQ84DRAFT_228966 [Glonium stellatum]|uniref:Uncharacterized protein n=1 Tax=Glonium stellatum TaxID=574774 RepID=A0A8E2EQ02_9PEZI|nr:hypothetical protein AOQ84DRAFT_228966 [Glonium stellatum]